MGLLVHLVAAGLLPCPLDLRGPAWVLQGPVVPGHAWLATGLCAV